MQETLRDSIEPIDIGRGGIRCDIFRDATSRRPFDVAGRSESQVTFAADAVAPRLTAVGRKGADFFTMNPLS